MMTTMTVEKLKVNVISLIMPLEKFPLGAEVFIKKEIDNKFDKFAMCVFVKHKKTQEWTQIGYVVANPYYLTSGSVSNYHLFKRMGDSKYSITGVVSKKQEITFKDGSLSTALIVDIELGE